ncbi:MAG: ATP-binding cassette domain-containing protein [Gemmatimonadales bacterium]|nr:ATP-binding cassette domain-containing protein [Gemmatimonadales bacterium]
MLTLSRISKRFGATIALDEVSLDVAAGEVHALLGENGAGKSTLMAIAAGLLRPDHGTVQHATDASGAAIPVALVHQHFTAIPALSVAENVALAAHWSDTGRRAEQRAAELIARLGLPLDPAARVESLPVQLRQRLEIVKALATDARVLLLDEPTAVLAPREVTGLLTMVREFAARGGAVVLITHKLTEAIAVADRITVLRRGTVTLTGAVADVTVTTLSRAMIGGDLPSALPRQVRGGDVRVTLDPVWSADPSPDAQPLTFRAGEIVGIAAIDGNGQRSLLRTIGGVATAPGVTVNGSVKFIPEDRTTEALIGDFTLVENLLLGTPAARRHWIDWRTARADTAALMDAWDVRASDPDVPAAALSGGNQQKFVMARALADSPAVLVAEDPTRGLDVKASAAIHARLRAAADGGAAVIVHAADLDEVRALADRLLVMVAGRLTELPRDTQRDLVGDAMLGLAVGTPG